MHNVSAMHSSINIHQLYGYNKNSILNFWTTEYEFVVCFFRLFFTGNTCLLFQCIVTMCLVRASNLASGLVLHMQQKIKKNKESVKKCVNYEHKQTKPIHYKKCTCFQYMGQIYLEGYSSKKFSFFLQIWHFITPTWCTVGSHIFCPGLGFTRDSQEMSCLGP